MAGDGDGLALTVRDGDRRRSLEVLRDLLGKACEAAEPRELAPLARQLTDVLRQLEELRADEGGSKLDELAARRRGRGAATADPGGAAGG